MRQVTGPRTRFSFWNMNIRRLECWSRLERVIAESGLSTHAFAKKIGLKRGENLYQIRRGNNGISIDVACRINRLYPKYSITWLMCGQEEVGPEAGMMMRIPCFSSFDRPHFPAGPNERYVCLSPELASNADAAIDFADERLFPGAGSGLLLLHRLRSGEEILYGNLHLIVLERELLLRIVGRTENSEQLLLRRAQPGPDDILMDRARIESLWLVTAAITRMIR